MPTLPQPSFASGELAPSLYGRVDFNRYYTGLKECKNWIVRQYGGLENRTGTEFFARGKDDTRKIRLIPFKFSETQSYILEFGHLYIRVHTDPVVDIVSPYGEDDLFRIQYVQKQDVMTLCHPNYKIRTLSRSTGSWTLADYVSKLGPFQDINIDTGITTTVSAETGTITITVTGGAIFTEDKIGALFYIEQNATDLTSRWEANTIYAPNVRVRAGYHYYEATTVDPASDSGTVRPSVTEGSETSGTAPTITWTYLHSGYGIARITAVGVNGLSCTATVISRMPFNLKTLGSYKWAFGAWSGEDNEDGADLYPGTVGYYQQRQMFGGSPAFPQTLWATETGSFNSFGVSSPIEDDDAITATMFSRDVAEIRHIVELQELLVLTSTGEWVVKGGGDNVLSPSNISLQRQSYNGANYLSPLVIGTMALYCQNKGNAVKSIGYSFDSDSFSGTDMSILSNHLFKNHTLKDWCYQAIPNTVVWAVRDDGVLLGMTFMPEHSVVAWHQHQLGGTDAVVESCCVIPQEVEDGTGRYEDFVYLVVKRNIIGIGNVRYLERLSSRSYADFKDISFLDSFLTYEGAAATTISGLDHLYGETVSALADGFVVEGLEVQKDGSTYFVELPFSASIVHIGLPYNSDMETLELSNAGQDLRTKEKLINKIHLIVEETSGLSAGHDKNNLLELKQRSVENYGEPVQPYTGQLEVHILGNWNRRGQFVVRQDKPLPATILSVNPEFAVGG